MSEKEFAVIGPPGCGKTTRIARESMNAAKKYGPNGVLICSLTKAAAREAAGKNSGLDSDMIGTLHAHCYHSLGRPTLVEDKHLESWNEEHPQFSLSKSSRGKSLAAARESGASPEDEERLNPGDRLLQQVDLYRSRMTPDDVWLPDAIAFYTNWSAWKEREGLVDFTDLIERALEDRPLAPNNPAVIFADEAQDHSRLEATLIRRWSRMTDSVVFVGDPDQALYHWRGADQEIFSGNHIPEENFRTLAQSYRVPRAVHAEAVQLIERIPGRRRIEYQPTDIEGEVQRPGLGFQRFEGYLPLLEETLTQNKRIMILCSCEFMLRPILRVLREQGIPYHNPYADRWNPLNVSHGISLKDRLLAFLKQHEQYGEVKPWTMRDIKLFASCLRSEQAGAGVLKRGAKVILEQIEDTDVRTGMPVLKLMAEIFTSEALSDLTELSVDWFQSNLLAKDQETIRFPLRVLHRMGLDGLHGANVKRPWKYHVTIGTIHSIKGGEAETVLVFPDLSPRGFTNLRTPGWSGHDAVLRMFYVAMTRAREKLVLGAPSGGMYINL